MPFVGNPYREDFTLEVDGWYDTYRVVRPEKDPPSLLAAGISLRSCIGTVDTYELRTDTLTDRRWFQWVGC